ncbi:MAG: DUF4058 family protein [Chloroflexota bacterium]
MPTPFPGMDPYLERPSLWREIHLQLIAELARKLNPILRPRYRVFTEQYTYTLTLFGATSVANDMIGVPDVMVVDTRSNQPSPSAQQPVLQHGVALAPVVAELPMPEEITERYLEIRDLKNGEVVTSIEVLSPVNKVPKDGRKQYEEKRLKVLGSRTHLIEIDLLRSGDPMPMTTAQALKSDYRILVSRAQQRPRGEIYFFCVRDPIPAIPVPLRPGEDEPYVDLNRLLHELYDLLNFDLVIDYTENPKPRFSKEDAQWVDRLLNEQGLR